MFLLPTLTLRYSPLRTAERGARMPRTALPRASQIFFFSSKYSSTYRYYYTRFVHTRHNAVLNHNARPAQISPAIYSPAAQRSAVRCRAVRCRALPCAAVLCRAVLCFLSNLQQYQGYTCCCALFFLFFLNLISLGPHVFSPTHITPVLPIRT